MRKKTTRVSGQTENNNQNNYTKKTIINQIIPRKTREKFLSTNQKKYYEELIKNQITIC